MSIILYVDVPSSSFSLKAYTAAIVKEEIFYMNDYILISGSVLIAIAIHSIHTTKVV